MSVHKKLIQTQFTVNTQYVNVDILNKGRGRKKRLHAYFFSEIVRRPPFTNRNYQQILHEIFVEDN